MQGTGVFGGFKAYRKKDGSIAFGEPEKKEEEATKSVETANK